MYLWETSQGNSFAPFHPSTLGIHLAVLFKSMMRPCTSTITTVLLLFMSLLYGAGIVPTRRRRLLSRVCAILSCKRSAVDTVVPQAPPWSEKHMITHPLTRSCHRSPGSGITQPIYYRGTPPGSQSLLLQTRPSPRLRPKSVSPVRSHPYR